MHFQQVGLGMYTNKRKKGKTLYPNFKVGYVHHAIVRKKPKVCK